MMSFRKLSVQRIVKKVATFRKFSNTAIDISTIMTAAGPLDITNKLNITNTAELAKWPVFQIMDQNGKIIEGE